MKKNKIFLFSAAALLAIGLVGCATDKPAETGTSTATQTETATATQTSTATAIPEVTITLTSTVDTVVAGEKIELTIETTHTTATPTVTVDDGTKGEIVTENGKTYLKGKAAGTVKVTATVAGKTAEKTFTVTPAPTIEVTAPYENVVIDEELKLTVTTANTDETYTVEVDDSTKATVTKKDDGYYYIKGVAAGTVKITAKTTKLTDELTLTVVPKVTAEAGIKKSELKIGEETKLLPTIKNNYRNAELSWSIDDPTKAEIVNKYGFDWLVAKASGTVTATLTCGTAKSTVTATIAEPNEDVLIIEYYSGDIEVGVTKDLIISVSSDNEATKLEYENLTPELAEVIFTEDEDSAYYSLKGLKAGTAKVKFTYGTKSEEFKVEIINAPIEATISVDQSALSVGGKAPVYIDVRNNINNVPLTVETLDAKVATITNEGGQYYVNGVSATEASGTTYIVVKNGTEEVGRRKIDVKETKTPRNEAKDTIVDTIAAEQKFLKNGTLTKIDYDNTNTATSNKTYDFEVYNNQKTYTKITDNKAEGNFEETYTYKEGESVHALTTSTVKGTTSYKSYKSKEMTAGEADDLLGSALFNTNLMARKGTVARFLKDNLSHYTLAAEGDGTLNHFRKTGETTYEYKVEKGNNYEYIECTLTFELDENGMIASYNYSGAKYKWKDSTTKTEKGDLKSRVEITATLTAGEKVAAPETFANHKDYAYVDYAPTITRNGEEITEAYVGETVQIGIKNSNPTEVPKDIDEVKISSILPADAAKADEYNNITLLKPCETLTINTTTNGGIDKSTSITIKNPTIDEITIDGLKAQVGIDGEKEFTILGTSEFFNAFEASANEAAAYEVTLLDGAPVGARIIKKGPNTFAIISPNLGKATIKVTSPLYKDAEGNPLTFTQEVEFLEADPITSDDIFLGLVGYFKVNDGYSMVTLDSQITSILTIVGGLTDEIFIDATVTDIALDEATGKWVITFESYENPEEGTTGVASIRFAEDADGNQILNNLVITVNGNATEFVLTPMPMGE